MAYSPAIAEWVIQEQIATVQFVDYWANLFALNKTTMDHLHATANKCGYTSYLNENLVFPPKGRFPTPPPQLNTSEECNVWSAIFTYYPPPPPHTHTYPSKARTELMIIKKTPRAAHLVNPCFNVYHITTTCPTLWDVLGYPASVKYLPEGAQIYFNRTDVKNAINAPQNTTWEECSDTNVFPNGDPSDPAVYSVLPRVIDKNERSIIAHGVLDFRFIANGTLYDAPLPPPTGRLRVLIIY